MSKRNRKKSSDHTNKRPTHFKKTFKQLLVYLKPHRLSLLFVLFAAILSTVFAVIGPKVMGSAIDVIFDGVKEHFQGGNGTMIDYQKLLYLLLLLAGLYLCSSLFQFIQQFIMAKVAQQTVYDLREEVFAKMNRLPLAYFDQHSHGDILSRVTNDIDTIASTLQQSVTQFITALVTIIGIIMMMLFISPLLTLIAVLSIPVSMFIIQPLIKKSQVYFRQQQDRLGALNGHVEEAYQGHQVVKAFGQEKQTLETMSKINDELYESGKSAQFISGIIMPFMSFIGNVSYVLISIVGGILVLGRSISIGDIQAFITYTNQFTQPIAQTANIANIIQSTIAAAERVFDMLDEEEEAQTAPLTNFPVVKGEVAFHDVDFGYGDSLLMEKLSISVKQGQTVAIVGPTGAGKTTIIQLLMRFYELNGGQITIDGIDITSISRKQLRNQFGMVLQDTWLFHGTIKENIAYGKTNASDDEIIQAAKTARADAFIQTLPDGYDTILNEEASNISQGQKQLITIARAMLANTPMMILDEATSSVDTRTELLIQQAMNALMENRTSFVIAHRLSTIKDADLILVMEDGNVIESGTHEELIARKGFYERLFMSQFHEEDAG